MTIGVEKMRPSNTKGHASVIHWLSAWMASAHSSGSSFIRSSTRLASVGSISA